MSQFAVGMAMKNARERGERIQIMLAPEELTALDDFRFKHRMPSRAAAIREILRRGLGVTSEMTGKAGAKSADFGVLADKANTRRNRVAP